MDRRGQFASLAISRGLRGLRLPCEEQQRVGIDLPVPDHLEFAAEDFGRKGVGLPGFPDQLMALRAVLEEVIGVLQGEEGTNFFGYRCEVRRLRGIEIGPCPFDQVRQASNDPGQSVHAVTLGVIWVVGAARIPLGSGLRLYVRTIPLDCAKMRANRLCWEKLIERRITAIMADRRAATALAVDVIKIECSHANIALQFMSEMFGRPGS